MWRVANGLIYIFSQKFEMNLFGWCKKVRKYHTILDNSLLPFGTTLKFRIAFNWHF